MTSGAERFGPTTNGLDPRELWLWRWLVYVTAIGFWPGDGKGANRG